MALDGIHPTFKQVPPKVPRDSTQAVYRIRKNKNIAHFYYFKQTNLQTELGCLNSSNISTRSTTNNDNIVGIYKSCMKKEINENQTTLLPFAAAKPRRVLLLCKHLMRFLRERANISRDQEREAVIFLAGHA